MNNWDELKEVVSMLRADADMSAGCGYEYDHLDKAATGIETLIEQNRELLRVLHAISSDCEPHSRIWSVCKGAISRATGEEA